MKRLGALTCVAVTLFAALALTVRLAAQEPQEKADKVQHYTVHDLGTLGGTLSWAYGINNKGSVTGVAFFARRHSDPCLSVAERPDDRPRDAWRREQQSEYQPQRERRGRGSR